MAEAEGMISSSTPMSPFPEQSQRERARIPLIKVHGVYLRIACSLLCGLSLAASLAMAEETVAITTRVSNGYTRTKLPDGSFKVETYAFGKGDDWGGARVDASAEKVDFMTVAKTVAAPLASRNYMPTRDAKTTDQLIMVYWGTTRAPEHASDTYATRMIVDVGREQDTAQMHLNHAHSEGEFKNAKIEVASAASDMRNAMVQLEIEQQQRETVDSKNVALLGYDSWWLATESASGGGERAFRKKDMLDEIEEDRYFVVLMAYDFQGIMKKKKPKLLWEAHISIREHSNEFDKRLETMVNQAAPFFGADSKGLTHFELPEGKVEVGVVKSLGVVPSN
jgi:hypothetical protein